MPTPNASDLSGSAAFQGLLSVGLMVLPAHTAAVRHLTADQIGVQQAEAEALARRLRALARQRSEISEAELAKLAQLAGLTPTDITDIMHRALTHGLALIEAFPELTSMDDHAKNMLIFDAMRRDEAFMNALKRATTDGVAAGDQASACKNACLLTFMMKLFAAQIDAVQRMMACAVLVFPPLVLACAAVMLILMIVAMTKANKEYTQCIEDCLEENGGGGGGED
ncbi:hypothetical protein ACGFIE_05975 [Micromonospora sp. NPDC049275]|uniref:hypothetical protein n=1 Tax=Micromonospora sp. NPDC049275 TaxID=3364268 RepID=UPI0037159EAC